MKAIIQPCPCGDTQYELFPDGTLMCCECSGIIQITCGTATSMKAEEALGLAIELVSDRLDLIRLRNLDERDGIQEGKLKGALSYLEDEYRKETK